MSRSQPRDSSHTSNRRLRGPGHHATHTGHHNPADAMTGPQLADAVRSAPSLESLRPQIAAAHISVIREAKGRLSSADAVRLVKARRQEQNKQSAKVNRENEARRRREKSLEDIILAHLTGTMTNLLDQPEDTPAAHQPLPKDLDDLVIDLDLCPPIAPLATDSAITLLATDFATPDLGFHVSDFQALSDNNAFFGPLSSAVLPLSCDPPQQGLHMVFPGRAADQSVHY